MTPRIRKSYLHIPGWNKFPKVGDRVRVVRPANEVEKTLAERPKHCVFTVKRYRDGKAVNNC